MGGVGVSVVPWDLCWHVGALWKQGLRLSPFKGLGFMQGRCEGSIICSIKIGNHDEPQVMKLVLHRCELPFRVLLSPATLSNLESCSPDRWQLSRNRADESKLAHGGAGVVFKGQAGSRGSALAGSFLGRGFIDFAET